jgi:hypothetical protein
MFGTVVLPATNFKRLLLFGSPSAEFAKGSSAPSAPEFLEKPLMRRNVFSASKSPVAVQRGG